MIIGGKAKSLKELEKLGFKIPQFFICDYSWSEEKILKKINQEMLGIRYFAVRSSAHGEDSKDKSFAGYFYSAVGVPKESIYDEFKKVIASYKDISGSVIIQEFIPSTSAGVTFSDAGDGTVIINSTIGLCKSVVEGAMCDEYITDKKGFILKQKVADNKSVLKFNKGQIFTKISSDESLSKHQVCEVVELAIKAEKAFGLAQDIEWCFLNEILYLLQSRPITKKLVFHEEEYFDSANIAESYSGIVLPLTCSFAKRVYQQVYEDFLRMSGVPNKQLVIHKYVFENLLSFRYGRMYYNMNNWYRLAQFVPGYKRNKENFETMITSNLRKEISSVIYPNFILKVFYPFIVLGKVIVFGFTSWRFKRYIQKNIIKLRQHDFKNLDFDKCKELFIFLENDLLRRWYITLENDFFVMTYLGLLKKLIPSDRLQDILVFESKATEQVEYLSILSQEMQKYEVVWKSIKERDVEMFLISLAKHSKLQKKYNRYFELFGGRFANELKLETIGIDEDISKFLSILEIYASYQVKNLKKDSYRYDNISFFKKIIIKLILNKFKKYASQREEFRLLRSNMFSITRRIFKRIGYIYVERGLLQSVDDIFYLTVGETMETKNKLSSSKLIEIVKKRKIEYKDFELETPPSHFVTTDGLLDMEKINTNSSDVIKARGVSSGIVTGRVKVMKEFSMPEQIDFDILVTKHTDPGWTALIALSKGLVIEHGGVLSHASIVARELGIPAVIGVKDATNKYKDGQLIEVNGSNGTIEIK